MSVGKLKRNQINFPNFKLRTIFVFSFLLCFFVSMLARKNLQLNNGIVHPTSHSLIVFLLRVARRSGLRVDAQRRW